MSKKSVGYYVWKSAFENPIVVKYNQNNVSGETKAFKTIEDAEIWVESQKNVKNFEFCRFVKTISGTPI